MARKLARDLGRSNVLPPIQGDFRARKNTLENAARFVYDVYEEFHRKEQALAVAVDLEDACNRVQFNMLMELIVQYGVRLAFTRWLAATLQKRKLAMRLGNGSPHQPTGNGTSTRLPLSPVLYNFCIQGLADLNSNGLCRVFKLADGGFIYKTVCDTHTAVTAVQEELENVTMVPRDRVPNQSTQGARPVVHPQLQSSRASNASSILQ